MSGFKLLPAPPAPSPLAGEGQDTCGEKFDHGVYCERPDGHDGGHLSESHHRYWQAAS